jgi:hypothetical protein
LRRAKFSILFLVSLIICSLTACDSNLGQGPISVRPSGGVLWVAVCETVTATSVEVEERSAGLFEEWVVSTSLSGDAEIVAGDVFSLSDPPAGLVASESVGPELAPGNELTVSLKGKSGEYFIAFFDVPEDASSSTPWINSDGSRTMEPCAL